MKPSFYRVLANKASLHGKRESPQTLGRGWSRWTGVVALAAVLSGCSSYLGGEPVRIQVKMKKYTFDPPVIRVKQGDLVELQVTATDVQHGFSIPSLDIREPVPRGQTATLRFRAEQRGEFKIQCSILCGPGHDDMQGTLIVE